MLVCLWADIKIKSIRGEKLSFWFFRHKSSSSWQNQQDFGHFSVLYCKEWRLQVIVLIIEFEIDTKAKVLYAGAMYVTWHNRKETVLGISDVIFSVHDTSCYKSIPYIIEDKISHLCAVDKDVGERISRGTIVQTCTQPSYCNFYVCQIKLWFVFVKYKLSFYCSTKICLFWLAFMLCLCIFMPKAWYGVPEPCSSVVIIVLLLVTISK